MMIITEERGTNPTTTYYRMRCDRCSKQTPPFLDRDHLLAQAAKWGAVVDDRLRPHRHYCYNHAGGDDGQR